MLAALSSATQCSPDAAASTHRLLLFIQTPAMQHTPAGRPAVCPLPIPKTCVTGCTECRHNSRQPMRHSAHHRKLDSSCLTKLACCNGKRCFLLARGQLPIADPVSNEGLPLHTQYSPLLSRAPKCTRYTRLYALLSSAHVDAREGSGTHRQLLHHCTRACSEQPSSSHHLEHPFSLHVSTLAAYLCITQLLCAPPADHRTPQQHQIIIGH